jgi:hypothetical protein
MDIGVLGFLILQYSTLHHSDSSCLSQSPMA